MTDRVLGDIDTDLDTSLARLFDWLKIASISTDPAYAGECRRAAEWVRGHALTGFPWNLIGYAWSGGFPGAIAVLQSAAWVGSYGLSFATVLAASLWTLFGKPLPAPKGQRDRAAGPLPRPLAS